MRLCRRAAAARLSGARRWIPVAGSLLALAVAAAGCGGDSVPVTVPPPPPVTPPTTPPPPPLVLPEDEDAVFFEVRLQAGFVPVEYSLGRAPLYRLTVAGDLYFEGPIAEIYPGYLLPNLRHARLDEDAFVEVLGALAPLALPATDDDFIDEFVRIVADAPSHEFLLTDQEGTHRLSVYALFVGEFSDPRGALLKRLLDVLGRVADISGAERWRGDRLQVWVLEAEPFHEPDLATEAAWPLAAPPGAPGDCRVFEGEEAARLLRVFEPANHGYRWTHEGSLYQLLARPLFPDEPGCER